MARQAISCLALVLLLAGCGQQARTADTTELDAVLRMAVEARQVPAVVAMVGTRERVAYEGAAGLPADAIFAIASMTKAVTSVAAMQLVEAGKVQLDEPAATYLPELRAVQVADDGAMRPPQSPPTVRQLLSHTSGFAYEFLNKEIADQVRSGTLPSAFTGTDEFLRAPLVFDPGTRWEYGISTDWVGKLVERVSGQSLDVYFRRNIFEPLGMSDTFFEVPVDKQSRVAPRYARQPDGALAGLPPEPFTRPAFFSGGGGLFSTAGDYLTFARALLAGGALDGQRILRTDTVDMMARNQLGDLAFAVPPTLDPQLVAPNMTLPGGLDAFGLGFALNRQPLVSGRGANTMSWAGVYNTFFWIDRDRDVAAVLMTQMLPFGDPGATRLVDDFDRAVYRVFR